MAKVKRYDLEDPKEVEVDQNRQVSPGQPPTLGQGTPSISRRERQRHLSRSFTQRSGYARNFQAPLENAVRNMPIIGPWAHSNLTSGDERLLEEQEANAPIQSAVSGGIGAGAATPLIRGATLGSNAIRHGLLGAADAGVERMSGNQADPITQAATYAVGSLAGRSGSTAVSPRGPKIHEIGRRAQEEHYRVQGTPGYISARDAYVNARVPPVHTFNQAKLQNHAARVRDARKKYSDMVFTHTFNRIRKNEFPDVNVGPPNVSLNVPDYLRGTGAGVIASMLGASGPHSVGIGMAGLLARPTLKHIERKLNVLGRSRLGRKYMNNTILNPETRDLLEAALTGTTQQGLDQQIPNEFQPYDAVTRQFRRPANAPQR